MRRALVIAGVMLAGLLAAVPVAAAPVRAPAEEEELEFVEEEEDVTFTLLVEGLTVNVFAEDNDGDQTAALTISRHGLVAQYLAPATITDDSVAASSAASAN